MLMVTDSYNYAEHVFHVKGSVEVDTDARSAVVQLWAQDGVPALRIVGIVTVFLAVLQMDKVSWKWLHRNMMPEKRPLISWEN